MAKSTSTVKKAPKAKPPKANGLTPASAKSMALRVESQRQRLFGVIGIVGCAREALGEELQRVSRTFKPHSTLPERS